MIENLTPIKLILDHIYLTLKSTNYILLGMLIIFAIHEIFKIYTYFKKDK